MGLRKKNGAAGPREERKGKQDKGIVGLRKKNAATGPREEKKASKKEVPWA